MVMHEFLVGIEIKIGRDSYTRLARPVKKFVVEGEEIRIHFEHAVGGLLVEGEKLPALELVPEQDFSWHIDGEELVLTIPGLRTDTKIHFAKQLFYHTRR